MCGQVWQQSRTSVTELQQSFTLMLQDDGRALAACAAFITLPEQ